MKIVYIVLAVVVLGLIAWYFMRKKNTQTTTGSNLTPVQTTIQVQPQQHITTGTKA